MQMTNAVDAAITPIPWPAGAFDSEASQGEHLDLRLWLVDLAAAGLDLAGPDHPWGLSNAERERAIRFRFDRDRRRYVVSRAALRRLLARATSRPEGEVHQRNGPHGKPALEAPPPHFNLSRSGDVAVVGLSASHELGVDVERLGAVADSAALAKEHFTATEHSAWRACDKGVRDLAFLLGWTRKEACLKAAGTGLAVAPSSFECGVTAQSRRLRLNDGERGFDLQVASWQPHPALVLSCAVVLRGAVPPA